MSAIEEQATAETESTDPQPDAVQDGDSLTQMLEELGPAVGSAGPLRVPNLSPGELPSAIGPDGEPIVVMDGDEDEVVDGDHERMRPPEANIGVELVSVEPGAKGVTVVDRRGGRFVRDDHLKRLSPVIREIARGRIGQLAKVAGAAGGDIRGCVEVAVVSAPVLCDVLEAGDGPGEVLVASAAVASDSLAGRVAEMLGRELARSEMSVNTRRARELGGLLRSLNASTAGGLTALARIRALKRRWDAEIRLLVRASRDEGHDDGRPRAEH